MIICESCGREIPEGEAHVDMDTICEVLCAGCCARAGAIDQELAWAAREVVRLAQYNSAANRWMIFDESFCRLKAALRPKEVAADGPGAES